MSRMYSLVEASKILGISPKTLQKYQLERKVPYRKLFGRVLFAEEDLEEIIEKAKVNPVPGSRSCRSASALWGD